MKIDDLLAESQQIWRKDQKVELSDVIVRLGKVFGDICRWERNAVKDAESHTENELKKELGNIIFSTIKWCDDLGYKPEECIELAIDCQKNSADKLLSA